MHEAVKQMVKKYRCHSQQDHINAIKEILQEIALLGLRRAKFFENAAFYGGSALRILYGLDRFSEDLDFSLLSKVTHFNLSPYNESILKELEAFGFSATIDIKIKSSQPDIESAFIKANSKKQLLTIDTPNDIIKNIHPMQTIKIKMEVDTNPTGSFDTESKFLLQPIPFSVKSFTEPNLFAGKIHALLCRPWIARVKGRDWYDFVWYISHHTPVNLSHLKERLIQSETWERQIPFNKNSLIALLIKKIDETDFDKAKEDIYLFIKDPTSIAIWAKEFFKTILNEIQVVNES